MLTDELQNILKRSTRLKYDEHIGKLLDIPQKYLSQIVPNRNIPISEFLKNYNSDTGTELIRFGKEVKNEIIRVLSNFDGLVFSEEDKNLVLLIIEEYIKPALYINRFTLMLGSIERTLNQYGLKFDQEKYRIDIPKALCEVDANNITRRIKSEITNELDILVQCSKLKNDVSESIIADTANILELKPNIMGIGINFNAIIDIIFRKRKI